jgi:phosphoenolpyruvate carboxykinase (GTP)
MNLGECKTTNAAVLGWVEKMVALCKPDRVFWCDGSLQEKEDLTAEAVRLGVLTPLNQTKLPGCYYHRSHPNDVARVEQCTFVCTDSEEETGPTNNWMPPDAMYRKLYALADGAMRGRTMYVIPYLMGPKESPLSKVGFELTDSIYVVLSMGIMTRMGDVAYQQLGNSDEFNRGLHCMLDVNPERRYIAHFPQDNAIISLGSNYGGNVLLGKKCLALRIGSYLGRQEGWLAEHMLIVGIENPEGEISYVCGAFPSACGKTNLAMLVPPASMKGWKIHTVGDDISWLRVGADGRLWAVNPEAGFFGVAPGTGSSTNPNAMATVKRDTIFTNVALRSDGTVWWEGHDDPTPRYAHDWRGKAWDPSSGQPAAHPNSRFTVSLKQCPTYSPEWEKPEGVPISAVLFGARRNKLVPLVYQSFSWQHGTFLGATLASETTAAATGAVGVVRRDPMAMLPFCGYNMGDYWAHWLSMSKRASNPPKIFRVNWFQRNDQGKFIWPGFGENLRVLRWVIERCKGGGAADETPIGYVPKAAALNGDGLKIAKSDLDQLVQVDREGWKSNLKSQAEYFDSYGDHLPAGIKEEHNALANRLKG